MSKKQRSTNQCVVTGIKSRVFNSRSHSMVATKVRKGANLVRVKVDGKTRKVSTKAMRMAKKKGMSVEQLVRQYSS
jgi:ribosomal protein L28